MNVDKDVLAVLSRAVVDGNALRIEEQLDRPMYVRVNKVIEAAGGKWMRGAKAHLFDKSAAERIDEIILTGQVEVPKDEFNYFPTPADIVDMLIDRAEIMPGMFVLEPSAGQGAIAIACHQRCAANVDCFELMEANYQAIVDHPSLTDVRHGDFLAQEKRPVYDRVVMNPPFSGQADIKHVNHALGFLKPDGILVAVMSAGVSFRDNRLTREFRDLVESRGGWFEDLPEGAFKAAGTMVRTVMVTIPGVAA